MSSENIPTVIDGFQIPTDPAVIADWYPEAADQVAMLDGDSDTLQSRNAHRQLAAARKAMEAAGLVHGGPQVGIEDARKRLGDHVTAAQQGTDVTITRNNRPAAVI